MDENSQMDNDQLRKSLLEAAAAHARQAKAYGAHTLGRSLHTETSELLRQAAKRIQKLAKVQKV